MGKVAVFFAGLMVAAMIILAITPMIPVAATGVSEALKPALVQNTSAQYTALEQLDGWLVANHTNPENSVTKAGSQGRFIVETYVLPKFASPTPPSDNGRLICYVVKSGQEIVRTVIMTMIDDGSWYMSVFRNNDGVWITSYPKDPGKVNFPHSMKGKGYDFMSVNCDDITPPPLGLATH